jgi:hypothetical protein
MDWENTPRELDHESDESTNRKLRMMTCISPQLEEVKYEMGPLPGFRSLPDESG